MTEEDAKTKWCPFARVFVETDDNAEASPAAGANRLETNGTGEPDLDWPAPRCIGSACMAWRSTRTMFRDARTGKLSDRDLTGTGSWVSTDGFCGLAGAPQ